MKYYKDPDGNLYKVDRETGERTLIQAAPESEQGEVSTPPETETTDNVED